MPQKILCIINRWLILQKFKTFFSYGDRKAWALQNQFFNHTSKMLGGERRILQVRNKPHICGRPLFPFGTGSHLRNCVRVRFLPPLMLEGPEFFKDLGPIFYFLFLHISFIFHHIYFIFLHFSFIFLHIDMFHVFAETSLLWQFSHLPLFLNLRAPLKRVLKKISRVSRPL